jgi:hypothetical protein
MNEMTKLATTIEVVQRAARQWEAVDYSEADLHKIAGAAYAALPVRSSTDTEADLELLHGVSDDYAEGQVLKEMMVMVDKRIQRGLNVMYGEGRNSGSVPQSYQLKRKLQDHRVRQAKREGWEVKPVPVI